MARSSEGFVPPTEWPCRYCSAWAYSWSRAALSQTAAEQAERGRRPRPSHAAVYASAYGADADDDQRVASALAEVALDDQSTWFSGSKRATTRWYPPRGEAEVATRSSGRRA